VCEPAKQKWHNKLNLWAVGGGSAEKRKERPTQVDIEIVQTENDLCAPFAHTHSHSQAYICTTVGRFIENKNIKTKKVRKHKAGKYEMDSFSTIILLKLYDFFVYTGLSNF